MRTIKVSRIPTPDEPWLPMELVFEWGTTLPFVILMQHERRPALDNPSLIHDNVWISGGCRIGSRGDAFTALMGDISNDITTRGAWAMNEAAGRPAPIEGYLISLS